jgi:predicted nucleic acid-binding protein
VILLDTSVLSLAYRRRSPDVAHLAVSTLTRMIEEDWPLAIPGIVLQEILSGLRAPEALERLKASLEGFQIQLATAEDHVRAAGIANACRRSEIAASTVDCLIASQAIGTGSRLFTLDEDFGRISSCCELALFQ